MQRRLKELASNNYDLVVVGGGIYGVAIVWDAVLRGLRVALVEKSDFSSGTSANSLKIIHGGLRYLQHVEVTRMRESVREQTALLRVAPHLVHPLPVLIPTYGHGIRGKEILSLALALNHLITVDYKLRCQPGRRLPWGRAASLQDVSRLAPGIEGRGLTGGVVFYDAQVRNSERLLLSFLKSAAKLGAEVANYVEVIGFIEHRGRVEGVQARDALTGNCFDICSKMVVLACGPWLGTLTRLLKCRQVAPASRFVKAINIVTRPIFGSHAVGVSGRTPPTDGNALVRRAHRLLFVTPWRGRSLIGTAYAHCDGSAEQLKVTRAEIERFITEINSACPSVNLKTEEVRFVHVGLLPAMADSSDGVQLATQYQIRDHGAEGVPGLISVTGVKYTTARDVAEKVVNHAFRSWDRQPPKTVSLVTSVHGGDIHDFAKFVAAESTRKISGFGSDSIGHLIHNYGSAYTEVLRHVSPFDTTDPVENNLLLKAETLHGIRAEMAQNLRDVVFRRTELGSAGDPGKETLGACAQIMAEELGWTPARMQQELASVASVFSAWH